MQLFLNASLIEQIRQQVDDQAEFNLLVSYLELTPNLSASSIFSKPATLEYLMGPHEDTDSLAGELSELLVTFCCLGSDIATEAEKLAQALPPENLPDSGDNSQMRGDEDVIGMPVNLHLLTTYFTFNFVELPGDFQSLVKQYYTRQCRGCRMQLQESAICLLCGEIVCLSNSRKCCGDRPGIKKLVRRNENGMGIFGGSVLEAEGEMSYHSRVCEGGNSIFLCPQNAQIFMIDQGRIVKGESPYRNALGETFSLKSAKWDNYQLSEASGGMQVLANLRKLFMEKKLPQYILNRR